MTCLPTFPDLSVQLTRRRARWVLDPNLALSQAGALLSRRLASFVELWLGPEFFNILDSAQVYQREPELLGAADVDDASVAHIPQALRDWTRFRDEAGRMLCWVGDALRESCLPDDVDERVVSQWEAASRSLDTCLPKSFEASGPLIASMRDAVALCAVLPTACVLALASDGNPPLICRNLAQWGLACERISVANELAGIERKLVLGLLAQAGIAPCIWGGLRLAVVHLFAPNIGRIEADGYDPASGPDLSPEEEEEPVQPCNPWEAVKCFWYEITEASN